MNLTFLHPHRSEIYAADVAEECTGAVALQGLIDAAFLDKPGQGGYDLALARTGAPVGPNVTLVACGVQEGDVINVLRRGSGA